MNVLILVEDRAIRHALEQRFQAREHRCIFIGVDDMVSHPDIPQFLKTENIQLILNTASMCLWETWPDKEILRGVRQLCAVCNDLNIILLQRSNSQVFDGLDSFTAHREDENPYPASRMGALNYQMEQVIQQRMQRYMILRVPHIFSAHGDNILTDLFQQLQESQQLAAADVGRAAPVAASDFARVFAALVDQLSCDVDRWQEPVWGVYHYASADPVSMRQFYQFVLERLQAKDMYEESLIVDSDEKIFAWRTPILDCKKLRSFFGIKQFSWRMAINKEIEQYFSLVDEPIK